MGICHLVRNTKMGTCHPFGPTWKMGMLNIWTKLRPFFKNGNLRFLTHSRDLGAIPPPKWSYGRRASFLFPKNTQKTQFGLFFPGCVFWWGVCPTRKGPGPRGPGPIWALAHMGPGPYGPWPIWALAHMGLGPYGPWPIWAMAHMGYVPDFYI